MTMDNAAESAVEVPGPFERAFNGIVVRDGHYYRSAGVQFVRLLVAAFILDALGNYVVVRDMWRGYPDLLGVPGLTAPLLGGAAIRAFVLSTMFVVTSGRERRRFNEASPPAPGLLTGGVADPAAHAPVEAKESS
jgi:hypothetical protein